MESWASSFDSFIYLHNVKARVLPSLGCNAECWNPSLKPASAVPSPSRWPPSRELLGVSEVRRAAADAARASKQGQFPVCSDRHICALLLETQRSGYWSCALRDFCLL